MTDNQESNLRSQESQNLANSDTSGTGGGEQTSGGQDIRAIMREVLREELAGDFGGEIDKRFQSFKDRRLSRLDDIETKQNEQQTTLDRISELVSGGMDFRAARVQAENEERFAYIDQLRSGQSQRPSQPQNDGSRSGVSESIDAVLELAGLEKTDPRVQSAISGKTGVDALQAIVSLGRTIKSKPPASPASISASPGGGVPRGDYADMTDSELGQRLSLLANQDPRFSKPERNKIIAELERRNPTKKIMR